MGGTIGAASEPGRGSTFWFELGLGAPLVTERIPDGTRETPRERIGGVRADAPLVIVAEFDSSPDGRTSGNRAGVSTISPSAPNVPVG